MKFYLEADNIWIDVIKAQIHPIINQPRINCNTPISIKRPEFCSL